VAETPSLFVSSFKWGSPRGIYMRSENYGVDTELTNMMLNVQNGHALVYTAIIHQNKQEIDTNWPLITPQIIGFGFTILAVHGSFTVVGCYLFIRPIMQ
jgi:hypothetical protein